MRRRSPGNGRLGRGLRRREKNATAGGCAAFWRTAQSRCSRAVLQPEDRCGSAIGRAILWKFPRPPWPGWPVARLGRRGGSVERPVSHGRVRSQADGTLARLHATGASNDRDRSHWRLAVHCGFYIPLRLRLMVALSPRRASRPSQRWIPIDPSVPRTSSFSGSGMPPGTA